MDPNSFFAQVDFSYEKVETSNGINTVQFIDATRQVVKLFDFLNPTAFSPVKSDMNGNIDKILKKHSEDPAKYVTLQAIVLAEQPLEQRKRVATEGLMWLRRGLEFTSSALRRNIDNPKEELSVSFQTAYGQTLVHHHNMFIKPVFYLAMKACPYRKDFYKKLYGKEDEAECIKQLDPWLSALEKNVKILVDFYKDGKHEW